MSPLQMSAAAISTKRSRSRSPPKALAAAAASSSSKSERRRSRSPNRRRSRSPPNPLREKLASALHSARCAARAYNDAKKQVEKRKVDSEKMRENLHKINVEFHRAGVAAIATDFLDRVSKLNKDTKTAPPTRDPRYHSNASNSEDESDLYCDLCAEISGEDGLYVYGHLRQKTLTLRFGAGYDSSEAPGSNEVRTKCRLCTECAAGLCLIVKEAKQYTVNDSAAFPNPKCDCESKEMKAKVSGLIKCSHKRVTADAVFSDTVWLSLDD
jgi:hypothetical protein